MLNFIKKLSKFPKTEAVFLVLTIAIFPRFLAFLVYEPIRSQDTPTYEQLAYQLINLDFSNYNGTRVPVYPIVLLVNNFDEHQIWLLQSILGFLTSILIFTIALNLSQKMHIAVLASIIYSLSLNQVFHEAQIMTEALTSFLLMVIVYFLSLYAKVVRKNDETMIIIVVLGFLASIIVLTHPIFVLIGPLLSIFVIAVGGYRKHWISALILLIIFIVPVSGWVVFNKVKLDFAGITTFMGFNLSNHSGAFIEKAPESEIRNIYLKYREKKIKKRGDHSMTIFEAAPEIYQKTGLTLPKLSKELSKISVSLFISYPHLYFISVAKSWISFWAVPNYWVIEKITPDVVRTALTKAWLGEQLILRIFNIFFILITFTLLFLLFKNRYLPDKQFLLLATSTLVLCISCTVAFFEYGETRYALVAQPLIILVVCVGFSIGWDYLCSRQNQ